MFAEIKIFRCVNCHGLWFDMLEKDDLAKIKGSDPIDVDNSAKISCECNVAVTQCCHG